MCKGAQVKTRENVCVLFFFYLDLVAIFLEDDATRYFLLYASTSEVQVVARSSATSCNMPSLLPPIKRICKKCFYMHNDSNVSLKQLKKLRNFPYRVIFLQEMKKDFLST